MIGSIKIKSGFARKLSCIENRTFEFTPGINVLYGPNGCGKTSLLRIMGAYASCWKRGIGGWSRQPHFNIADESKIKFPGLLRQNAIGECSADVAWDGSPAIYNEAVVSDNISFNNWGMDAKDSPDGMTGRDEQMQMLLGHHSTGYIRLWKISKLYGMLKEENFPDLEKLGKHSTPVQKAFVRYIKSLPRCGPATLILDEPDRGLSYEFNQRFWSKVLPTWCESKNLQIIVSTQSIWPALMELDSINIIEMRKGYAKNMCYTMFLSMSNRMFESMDEIRGMREKGSNRAEEVKRPRTAAEIRSEQRKRKHEIHKEKRVIEEKEIQTAKSYYDNGIVAAHRGRYNEALGCFNQAIRLD